MSSRLRRDLKWSSHEGSSCCVMLGAGENSLAPFVLAAGHSGLASGLITTVPLFIGAVLQNFAPWALGRLGSVRTWSVGMAGLQGLCLIALGGFALSGSISLFALFGLASLYWAAGWSVGPAWNTWMDSMIPGRLRARFFAKRNAFCMLIQWATMMAASGLLYWGQQFSQSLPVFSGLFLLAGLARWYSAWSMSRQSEPVPLPENYSVLGLQQAFQTVYSNPKARPLVYMLAAQFSMALAAPFLVPFLSEIHQFSYGEVLLCVAVAIFSRALVLPRLGKKANRWGCLRMFKVSGWGLATIPLLWLIPGLGLGGFLVLQLVTGAFLAVYEMGVTLVYLEAVPVADRTSVLTRFSIFNTLAMLLGSSVGAVFLMGASGLAPYATLFAVAAAVRLSALRVLPWCEASPVATRQLVKPRFIHHLLASHLSGRAQAENSELSKAKRTLEV